MCRCLDDVVVFLVCQDVFQDGVELCDLHLVETRLMWDANPEYFRLMRCEYARASSAKFIFFGFHCILNIFHQPSYACANNMIDAKTKVVNKLENVKIRYANQESRKSSVHVESFYE